jgi:Ca-activated chloride channel family protein
MKLWAISIAVFLVSGTVLALFLSGAFDPSDQGKNRSSGGRDAPETDSNGDVQATQGTGASGKRVVRLARSELVFSGKTAKQLLEPLPFTTRDGKREGWKVVIPGGRPLATPAVVGGKVFLGGGFGSHEFYAFHAATGRNAWSYRCKDDGPTSAVVQDGYVVFNTESCELEVLTTAGRRVWKKWLGDPLMSMPAVDQGRVYMAYPDSKGDHQHRLACFDLKTGKEYWKQPIAGEIITAPVVAGKRIYLTTLEGTLHCFHRASGRLAWKDKRTATSSPVVWNRECYFSHRREVTLARAGKQQTEQTEELAVSSDWGGSPSAVKVYDGTNQPAPYLDHGKKKASARYKKKVLQDASVGFGGSKGDAKINQAEANLGEGTVAGIWAYQGSKPFIYRNRLYAAMGDTLRCLNPRTEKVLWTRTLHPPGVRSKAAPVESVLTPPALVNGKVFLGTTWGEVICLSARSGQVLWRTATGEPIVFQPAVAAGRVFVATQSGSLVCLMTGDAKDDGWFMWGASAAHNGRAK